ncbi:LysR family transcriptional regulator [Aureibacillus halotolerans]|uniref:DNA-binding transcriptional LysR family regulator n=1 Tax=Aureibacillus halotolerans TaxID=1508390 RepID=A0A4R6UIF7_9BACI|nr:LysR family transcriptional regulator [Aureibacillus halotolerans]TDQ42954.1 DNA-binding transcriptional LysR family regulator [Aureibacillus halotolerans]
MELIDLRMVVTIQQEGNITRAAEKLGYVQSNLTMRIRKLEAELGVQIFHRDRKGVTPTEKGILLCNYATNILRMTEETIAAVTEAEYPCGSLTIGVVETIASTPSFIRALFEFQKNYPEVYLRLSTGTSPQNYQKVLNGELDGAFLTGEYDLTSVHVAYEFEEEVFLLTSTHEKEKADLPDFNKIAWVVFPEGCPLRKANSTWLQTKGVPFDNIIEVSALDTMLNCVRAGIGSSLLTESVVDKEDEQIQAYQVPEQFRYATSRLVTRKSLFLSKTFKAFAACFEEAMNLRNNINKV